MARAQSRLQRCDPISPARAPTPRRSWPGPRTARRAPCLARCRARPGRELSRWRCPPMTASRSSRSSSATRWPSSTCTRRSPAASARPISRARCRWHCPGGARRVAGRALDLRHQRVRQGSRNSPGCRHGHRDRPAPGRNQACRCGRRHGSRGVQPRAGGHLSRRKGRVGDRQGERRCARLLGRGAAYRSGPSTLRILRSQPGARAAASSSGSRPCCTANIAAAARLEAPILA